MSSLSDILTAAKNVVTAISQLGQTYLKIQGTAKSDTITAPTLVYSGQCRLASISVITSSGSVNGMVYDSSNVSSLTSPMAIIEHPVGIKVINMPVNNGILVVPGAGMSVVVSYSE
jgi:hypothetical protein